MYPKGPFIMLTASPIQHNFCKIIFELLNLHCCHLLCYVALVRALNKLFPLGV